MGVRYACSNVGCTRGYVIPIVMLDAQGGRCTCSNIGCTWGYVIPIVVLDAQGVRHSYSNVGCESFKHRDYSLSPALH